MSTTYPDQVAFGIDVGGSGIKGAPVDLTKGIFHAKRTRIPTPGESTPTAVAEVIGQIVEKYGVPQGMPIGVALPAPILGGIVPSMANLSQEWAGVDAAALFESTLGRPVTVVNDADAAGLAEVEYGKAKEIGGTAMVLTLGTGIGSALIADGHLVANTELGHLNIGEAPDAEQWTSDAARDRDGLSMKDWAGRLQVYFNHIERLFNPDVIIIGGGVSKKSDQYLPHISTRAPIIPAELLNTAGIVGAALAARRAMPVPEEAGKATKDGKASKPKKDKKSKKDKSGKKGKAKKKSKK